jgi:hypothetical protein
MVEFEGSLHGIHMIRILASADSSTPVIEILPQYVRELEMAKSAVYLSGK